MEGRDGRPDRVQLEMYADGARISVSVATIEFTGSGSGTQLTWIEQGVYLDGHNGAEAPGNAQGRDDRHAQWPNRLPAAPGDGLRDRRVTGMCAA